MTDINIKSQEFYEWGDKITDQVFVDGYFAKWILKNEYAIKCLMENKAAIIPLEERFYGFSKVITKSNGRFIDIQDNPLNRPMKIRRLDSVVKK